MSRLWHCLLPDRAQRLCHVPHVDVHTPHAPRSAMYHVLSRGNGVSHTHTHTHTHTHRRQVSGYRNSQRRVGVRVLYSSLGCGSLGGLEEGVGVLYSSARHHGSRVVYSSARQTEFLWCVVGRHDAWRVLDRSPHQANRQGCPDGRRCTVWPTLHADASTLPCKVLASVHATCIGACVRRAQQGTRANKEAGGTCRTRKARCKIL